MNRVGIIGLGNMGSAMIRGMITSNEFNLENIVVYDRNKYKIDDFLDEFSVKSVKNEEELVRNSDYIIIAVKPNAYEEVLSKIKNEINDKVIITIAAGISIDDVKKIIGKDKKVVRTMPNTPVMVLEGMSAIVFDLEIRDYEKDYVKKIFNSFGSCEVVEEKLIDSVIGIAGSSPAYVYMFIEALADAAVLNGMKRDMAYKFASKAVLGSAKMVLETKIHPGKLKDMVTSPSGTTIEAVKELEKNNFRYAIISAVDKCVEKSKIMSKKEK